MKYEVVIYGSPVLREKAVPVDNVDGPIKRLAKDMLETMYRSQGIGLAAEQIGRTESILVIDISGAREADDKDEPQKCPDVPMPLVMINPEIIDSRGEQTGREGCLSFPEVCVPVTRAEEITATYLDVDNKEKTIRATALLARVIQHEVDHLNGVLMIDHISPVQKIAIAGQLKRLKRGK